MVSLCIYIVVPIGSFVNGSPYVYSKGLVPLFPYVGLRVEGLVKRVGQFPGKTGNKGQGPIVPRFKGSGGSFPVPSDPGPARPRPSGKWVQRSTDSPPSSIGKGSYALRAFLSSADRAKDGFEGTSSRPKCSGLSLSQGLASP